MSLDEKVLNSWTALNDVFNYENINSNLEDVQKILSNKYNYSDQDRWEINYLLQIIGRTKYMRDDRMEERNNEVGLAKQLFLDYYNTLLPKSVLPQKYQGGRRMRYRSRKMKKHKKSKSHKKIKRTKRRRY